MVNGVDDHGQNFRREVELTTCWNVTNNSPLKIDTSRLKALEENRGMTADTKKWERKSFFYRGLINFFWRSFICRQG